MKKSLVLLLLLVLALGLAPMLGHADGHCVSESGLTACADESGASVTDSDGNYGSVTIDEDGNVDACGSHADIGEGCLSDL